MDSVTIDCIFSAVTIEPCGLNTGNNSDTWDVTFNTQQAMLVNGVETNELKFTVVGGWELAGLSEAFAVAAGVAK